MPTQQVTKTTIRRCPDTKEYIVKAYTADGRYPAADYYTDDKDDAEATAALMTAGAIPAIPTPNNGATVISATYLPTEGHHVTICRYLGQYVVWTYLMPSGSCECGRYFDRYEDALATYLDKLAELNLVAARGTLIDELGQLGKRDDGPELEDRS